MKLAIVGSRDGLPWAKVRDEIERIVSRADVELVISGGASGVDQLAASIARRAGKKVREYLPDWRAWGKRAGFLRNQTIVDAADAIVAFWDGASRGTANTITLSRDAGKPTTVYDYSNGLVGP